MINYRNVVPWSWGDLSEAQLSESWYNNSTPELVSENGYISHALDTYFGSVYFNERTVDMYYFPEHKYANLWFASHRTFILEFSRMFAKLLGQSQIVYYNDQSITSKIGDEATEGKSIDEIIENAILDYGKPIDSLKEAIHKYFIIDNTNHPLKDMEGDF